MTGEYKAVLGICANPTCGKAVSAHDLWAARQIAAWERLKDGVTRGRQPTGQVLCRGCFSELKAGAVTANQGGLF